MTNYYKYYTYKLDYIALKNINMKGGAKNKKFKVGDFVMIKWPMDSIKTTKVSDDNHKLKHAMWSEV